MYKYEVDIYYSGYITVSVEAANEAQALEIATEEAARFHNKREGDFIEKLMPNLEPWPEASTARRIDE